MAEDARILSTGAEEGSQRVDIRPTLLIGLGGTGKEVLRRLRRMFYEKYRVPGLPVMEYLWFDTDIRNQSLSGETSDELDKLVDLTSQQKIDGRVRPDELNGYRRQKNSYPHIWDWFPSELDALPSDAIMQGAGQIRPCGRLAFFRHYTELRDAIESLVRKVTAQEAFQSMNDNYPDYTVDANALEIIIVASIGGGTGSGCFIDVGFLCRDLFRDSTRTAFLVMPTVFDEVVGSAGREAVRANGFAALKELEYFMQPRFIATDEEDSDYSTHEFNWGGGSRPRKVEAPPFSTVYMLDNENMAGERITEFTDTFQTIAEFLLLDFDRTGFAADKRSVRSNLEQYLQDVATFRNGSYVQYFPCRYASFGLSQIELNQPRLANAAANRCSQYLVEFIMAKDNEIPPGYDDEDVKPHLKRMGLTKELFLQRCLSKQGRDFTLSEEIINNLLEPAFGELLVEMRESPAIGDRESLENQVAQTQRRINELVIQVRERIQEGLLQAGTNKGDDLGQILENIGLDRPKLEEQVENYCLELLCNPLQYGPNFMVKWLGIATEALEQVRGELQDMANRSIEALEAPKIKIEFSDEYEKYNARLRAVREEMPFALLTKRIAIGHYQERVRNSFNRNAQLITRDLVQQVEAVRDQLKQWVSEHYEQEAARRLLNPNSGDQEEEKGLIDNLISFVGQQLEVRGEDGELRVEISGLMAKVQEFQNHLQDMADRFNRLYESYSQRTDSVRNLSLMPILNYREEIETYLRNKKGRTGANFRAILQDILAAYFRSEAARPLFAEYANREGTEVDAIRDCTRIIFNRSANIGNAPRAWEEIEASLDTFSFDLFKEFQTDTNAVQMMQNLNYNEVEEIKKRARLAEPRMSKSQPFPDMNFHVRNTIGLPQGERQWETLAQENVRTSEPSPYQAARHTPDSVVFVSQWMAFPLFAIDSLEELHEAYDNNLRVPENVFRRHMTKDYITYPEILPPRDDEQVRALVEALQPLIDGILLNVVTFGERGFYRTYRARGRRHEDYYGPNIEIARQTLALDRTRRDRLRQEVQKIQDNWLGNKNPRVFEQYLALQSHLVDNVYPEISFRIRGQEVKANDLFLDDNLLQEAFDKNFEQTQKVLRFSCDEEELNQAIKRYLDDKDLASCFAHRKAITTGRRPLVKR